MPHWELGFLKIGATRFSLSKTESALRCREENLVTLVRGQGSARRWLWQERYLPGARAAWQLQREADSRQRQRALSHHVPAPRDTAPIPTAGHAEYSSRQRTAQAEPTLAELGRWSRHSHTARRREHLLPSTAASAGNAAPRNAGALHEQHPGTQLPATHCNASGLCREKKSHTVKVYSFCYPTGKLWSWHQVLFNKYCLIRHLAVITSPVGTNGIFTVIFKASKLLKNRTQQPDVHTFPKDSPQPQHFESQDS